MKTVFMTGVTGYIGGSVAARLLKAGYHVNGLARNEKDFAGLTGGGIQAGDQIHLYGRRSR